MVADIITLPKAGGNSVVEKDALTIKTDKKLDLLNKLLSLGGYKGGKIPSWAHFDELTQHPQFSLYGATGALETLRRGFAKFKAGSVPEGISVSLTAQVSYDDVNSKDNLAAERSMREAFFKVFDKDWGCNPRELGFQSLEEARVLFEINRLTLGKDEKKVPKFLSKKLMESFPRLEKPAETPTADIFERDTINSSVEPSKPPIFMTPLHTFEHKSSALSSAMPFSEIHEQIFDNSVPPGVVPAPEEERDKTENLRTLISSVHRSLTEIDDDILGSIYGSHLYFGKVIPDVHFTIRRDFLKHVLSHKDEFNLEPGKSAEYNLRKHFSSQCEGKCTHGSGETPWWKSIKRGEIHTSKLEEFLTLCDDVFSEQGGGAFRFFLDEIQKKEHGSNINTYRKAAFLYLFAKHSLNQPDREMPYFLTHADRVHSILNDLSNRPLTLENLNDVNLQNILSHAINYPSFKFNDPIIASAPENHASEAPPEAPPETPPEETEVAGNKKPPFWRKLFLRVVSAYAVTTTALAFFNPTLLTSPPLSDSFNDASLSAVVAPEVSSEKTSNVVVISDHAPTNFDTAKSNIDAVLDAALAAEVAPEALGDKRSNTTIPVPPTIKKPDALKGFETVTIIDFAPKAPKDLAALMKQPPLPAITTFTPPPTLNRAPLQNDKQISVTALRGESSGTSVLSVAKKAPALPVTQIVEASPREVAPLVTKSYIINKGKKGFSGGDLSFTIHTNDDNRIVRVQGSDPSYMTFLGRRLDTSDNSIRYPNGNPVTDILGKKAVFVAEKIETPKNASAQMIAEKTFHQAKEAQVAETFLPPMPKTKPQDRTLASSVAPDKTPFPSISPKTKAITFSMATTLPTLKPEFIEPAHIPFITVTQADRTPNAHVSPFKNAPAASRIAPMPAEKPVRVKMPRYVAPTLTEVAANTAPPMATPFPSFDPRSSLSANGETLSAEGKAPKVEGFTFKL